MSKHPWPSTVTVALVLAILLGGCASPQGPSASVSTSPQVGQATKRVLVGIRGAPTALSAAKSSGSNVAGLDGLELLVQAGLAHFDNHDVLRPQLGEAVPSIENGLWRVLPDGRMEMVWRIKEAAAWHDGTRVTAGDLLFTVEVEQDQEVGIFRDAIYDLIEGVEARDDRTVAVRWKQSFIDADALFTHAVTAPMPRHILEMLYREDKAGFFGVPYWSHEYVGAGPYKVREWVVDSHVLLEANDGYILGRPKVHEIELKFIPDPNTLHANVLAGAVEITLGRGLDFQQGVQLAEQWKEGSVVWHSSSWFKLSPQFVDPRPAVVTDLRFRRALMHATHRQEMADTFTGGLAAVADTLVLPHVPEFKAVEGSIVRYEYDPRRAVQMIESLGYARGADGVFRDAAGQKLTIESRTTIGLPIQGTITFALSDYWKRVGVDAETGLISVQQMRDREHRATFPAFEMVSGSASLTAKDVGRWHSSKTPLPENRFQSTGNEPRYKHPEFDALLERYITTIPKDERVQALAGIVRHQTENLNMMGLFYTVNPSLIAHRLQNVTARSSRANEAWNAHEWDMK